METHTQFLKGSTVQAVVVILNLVVSLASAAWAVAGLIRPAIMSGTAAADRGEIFYARMYAARAIPFGFLAGILPFHSSGTATSCVLFTAAVVQIVDIVIALGKREPGMALGAAAGATVHILCGLTIISS